MLFKYSTILVFSIVAALEVHASALPRNNCHTIDSGSIAALIMGTTNQVLDLNSQKALIWGSGRAVNAEFQACPKLGSTVGFEWTGRIIITESDNCLTVINPSGGPPYFVSAKKCSSSTKPSSAQTWAYGNHLGDNIFYVGNPQCRSGAGVSLNANQIPITPPNSQIELSCGLSASIEPLTLKH